MGGLVVATLLTLVFLPTLYVTWFRIKAPARDGAPAEAGHANATETASDHADLFPETLGATA
jgi:hypothetical protein